MRESSLVSETAAGSPRESRRSHPNSTKCVPQQRVEEAASAGSDFAVGAPLDVQVRFVPSLPVIRLRGELDVSNVHLLQDAVESLVVSRCGHDVVVMDMGELDFCDVTGLTAINQARIRLAGLGKALVLGNPSETFRKLLKVTGLDTEFP